MARTNVPLTNAAINSGVVVTPTALDATNNHNIPNPKKHRNLLVRVTNSTGTTKIITFKAGAKFDQGNTGTAGGPAIRSALGDLAVSMATTAIIVVELESARFAQADGSINVDLAASMTGFIDAYFMDNSAS